MSLIAIFCTVLTAVFVGFKLANVIAWSWLWVLSPIWIPIAIIIVIFCISCLQEAFDSIIEN